MSTELNEIRKRPRLPNDGPRMNREKEIVSIMVGKYCKGMQHLSRQKKQAGDRERANKKSWRAGKIKRSSDTRAQLCSDCTELLDYAYRRLESCRFGELKRTCARCPVHCYKTDRRTEIKAVMRYAAPRMLCSHPLAVLRHALDGFSRERRKHIPASKR